MAKVELKQPIIDEIKGFLDGAVAATVVDYRGLTFYNRTLELQLGRGLCKLCKNSCCRSSIVLRYSKSGRSV